MGRGLVGLRMLQAPRVRYRHHTKTEKPRKGTALWSELQLLSVALCEIGNFLCCLEINQL